eukprot:1178682-Prorocentrum_minimum.AAC.2
MKEPASLSVAMQQRYDTGELRYRLTANTWTQQRKGRCVTQLVDLEVSAVLLTDELRTLSEKGKPVSHSKLRTLQKIRF